MSETLTASEHPKIQEILHNCGVGLDNMDMDEEALQRVVRRARELQKGVIELATSLSRTDQYAHQQVVSAWEYPPEYQGPKDFREQCNILMDLLPGLDPEKALKWHNDVYLKLEIAGWIEGLFAVPSEAALARQFYPNIQGRLAQYCAGVSLLLQKIDESRAFQNCPSAQRDPEHLWRTERTIEMLDRLRELQGQPDIIGLPTQLGMLYRGQSVPYACEKFTHNEFAAGSLEGAAFVLIHPEREDCFEQLHMELPGDCCLGAGRDARTPYLDICAGRVRYGASKNNGNGRYGVVSCWLPPH